jgi:hypothetical protein
MSRALVTIRTDADRGRIWAWICKAPIGTRVEFKASKRSVPQNDRMWAMLTDIATQLKWHGQRLDTNDWKLLFLDALKREERTVPSIEGDGVVNLGRSSSDLSKQEMTDLIQLIAAFGVNHGVTFNDPAVAA